MGMLLYDWWEGGSQTCLSTIRRHVDLTMRNPFEDPT